MTLSGFHCNYLFEAKFTLEDCGGPGFDAVDEDILQMGSRGGESLLRDQLPPVKLKERDKR